MKITLSLLISILGISILQLSAQSPNCTSATSFCVETGLTFPASINAPSPPATNNYGCLATQPNPTWFYMTSRGAGPTTVNLSSSPSVDIDFAVWGPFSSVSDAQDRCGSLGPPINCSYTPTTSEVISFVASAPDKVYLLLITNFSDYRTDISAVALDTMLACGDSLVAPVAIFDQSDTSACASFSVTYDASPSTNVGSFYWTFPGGDPSRSRLPVQTVTYSDGGIFDAQLIVTNFVGADTLVAEDLISVMPQVNPMFTADVDMLSVDFTNMSTNSDTYFWDFGNGETSTDVNPSVQYASPGAYHVVLKGTNSCGVDSVFSRVVVAEGLPIVAFSYQSDSSCVPSLVSFTDESSVNPSSSWLWSIVSNTGASFSSTEQNPSFNITQPGVYSVTLDATNEFGTATGEQIDFFTLYGVPTSDATIISVSNETVQFMAAPLDADSYLWDFGDGNTAITIDPIHTYAASGSYDVELRSTNSCGWREHSIDVNIMVSGLGELPSGAAFELFPNPTEGRVSWSLTGVPSEPLVLTVTDVLGSEILNERLGTASTFRQNLNLENWAAGIYYIRLKAGSYEHQVRIVKQ
ncbi:MAG: PKD domain-containing protein [Saprospiraceae bacterium]